MTGPRTRLDIEPVNSPKKTAAVESGIITCSATLDDIAKIGQGTSETSYWQDLDADEAPNISNDDPDDQGAVGKPSRAACVPEPCTSTRLRCLRPGSRTGQLRADAAHPQLLSRVSKSWRPTKAFRQKDTRRFCAECRKPRVPGLEPGQCCTGFPSKVDGWTRSRSPQLWG